eukprot:GHVP01051582.1.p1 GENE.GHVP01051582.1~~GHVP01051582.1.p1  ORF type:complete len:904 (+),score=114.22 GHVP01051582.1:823-3534(+)
MIRPFRTWGIDLRWTVPLYQGSVGHAVFSHGPTVCNVYLIGRRNAKKWGTRYKSRGVDADGNVANFVETEMLVNIHSNKISVATPSSYNWEVLVQIRGSVPLYWSQSSQLLSFNPPPKINKSQSQNAAAFKKHMDKVFALYGSPVTLVNLLSHSKNNEPVLSNAYKMFLNMYSEFYRKDNNDLVPFHFDFHDVIKGGLHTGLDQLFDLDFGNTVEKIGHNTISGGRIIRRQNGVCRTNCMDCLDRTNAMQWFIAWRWVSRLIHSYSLQSLILCGGVKFEKGDSGMVVQNAHRSATPPMRSGSRLSVFEKQQGPSSDVESDQTKTATYNPRKSERPVGGDDNVNKIQVLILSPIVTPSRLVFHPLVEDKYDPTIQYKSSAVTACIFRDVIAHMWADHGDSVSQAYIGTPSVISSHLKLGKKSIWSLSDHLGISVKRHFKDNILDQDRQQHIEILLGKHYRSHGSAATVVGTQLTEEAKNRGKKPIEISLDEYQAAIKNSSPVSLSVESESVGTSGSESDEATEPEEGLQEPICENFDLDSLCAAMDQNSSLLSVPKVASKIHHVKSSPSLQLTEPEIFDKDYRIWIGTWNLGGFIPKELPSNWLNPQGTDGPGIGIYCFCFQEILEMTAYKYITTGSSKMKEKEKIISLLAWQCIGKKEYKLIAKESLKGLLTLIFVHTSILQQLKQLMSTKLKFGYKVPLMTRLGNKGAIGIRMNFAGRTLAFINTHLVKGDMKGDERFAHFQDILDSPFDAGYRKVKHHEFVFIAGDLNSTINLTDNHLLHALREASKTSDFSNLLMHDEVSGWIKQLDKKVWEEKITFMPTYKFLVGDKRYDRQIPPAWCDRIVASGIAKKPPQLLCYKSDNRVCISDHKPVSLIAVINGDQLESPESHLRKSKGKIDWRD